MLGRVVHVDACHCDWQLVHVVAEEREEDDEEEVPLLVHG